MTASQRGNPSVVPAGRRPELDAIRALVVLGLFVFHSALVFATDDDFYVKNDETTDAILILGGFAVIWAMPMLFLIGGLGSWHSLRRRGPAGLATERLRRLGVPLLFATVALLPLPQWYRQRADPTYEESYLEFWPRFFNVRFAPENFPFVLRGSYFESGHLWFVVLLLVFSLLVAGAARWLPSRALASAHDRMAAAVRHRGVILLPAVPVAAVTAGLGMETDFAAWHRWAYLLFFLYGLLLATDGRFRAAMFRDAKLAAVIGATLFLAVLPGILLADDPFTDMTPLALATRVAYGAAGWCWLVAILGLLDQRRMRRQPTPTSGISETSSASTVPSRYGWARRWYSYIGPAVLPLYVLHQPVVVAVAFEVVKWELPMAVKFVIIVGASFVITVAGYELFVRRFRLSRFLFGMRPT
ncbi:acyltransferase family protein [Phytoactinopolyspora limicola]|uniref:acyltransferase family protein n=1 Tax=Phytoactinopolyspora limicola TaxID=2715536 RepID=UPI00140DA69E|nr:acyltransferase family protein [Phytoactinopolyspora limicola]